jgi:hypothetical protein
MLRAECLEQTAGLRDEHCASDSTSVCRDATASPVGQGRTGERREKVPHGDCTVVPQRPHTSSHQKAAFLFQQQPVGSMYSRRSDETGLRRDDAVNRRRFRGSKEAAILVQLQPKSSARSRRAKGSRECPGDAFNERRSSSNVKMMGKQSHGAQRAAFSKQLQNDESRRLADRNSNGRWTTHSTSFQTTEDEKSAMRQRPTRADTCDGRHSTRVVAFFVQAQPTNGACFRRSSRSKTRQSDAADRERSKPNILHRKTTKSSSLLLGNQGRALHPPTVVPKDPDKPSGYTNSCQRTGVQYTHQSRRGDALDNQTRRGRRQKMRTRHLSLHDMSHASRDATRDRVVDLGRVEGMSSATKVANAIWIDNNGVLPLSGPEIGARPSEMSPDVSSEWNAHLRKLWVRRIGCTSREKEEEAS